MSGFAAAVFSIAVIAALVLMAAGTRSALRREQRKQGLLMLVAGLVILGNVLIWTV